MRSALKCEERKMEEGKIDLNEMKDNTDHVDQDPSPSTVEEVKLPEVGMIFSSEEEVRTFYNSYATNVGFGISKLGGRNGDDGKQKYFSIGCAKNRKKVSQAKNVLHPRPSSKTNCKAKINVAVRNDGNFVITSVYIEHNHILSPGKSRHFRFEAGGYENLSFDERNCRNYISEARRWRKDIKRGYQSISNIYDDYDCGEKRLRYNTLTPLMQEVQQLGAESDDICSILMEIMKDTKEKLIIAMENGQSRAEQLEEASTSGTKAIHSPLKVRTKAMSTGFLADDGMKIQEEDEACWEEESVAEGEDAAVLLKKLGHDTNFAGRRIRAGEGEEKMAKEGDLRTTMEK
ncbi:hypothetical protein ZIOFF_062707 [Zingiber officinale]|uniref:FAR1 domain-containing protein n=1 Tax=Zingiber officinale TaxID=94328 RepID=A0A8J5K9F1_ZINOF|nr:hypothetical protein ZIOFF_062707 [Zingiber officinale]